MSYVGDEAARILTEKGLPPAIHETYGNDIADFTPIITKMKEKEKAKKEEEMRELARKTREERFPFFFFFFLF